MKGEQGFTLVELLAALAAGSLLLVALGALIGSFAKERREFGRSNDGFEQLAAASPQLTNLLSHVLLNRDGSSSVVDEDDRLQAKVEPPEGLGPVGPLNLELAVRKGDDGEALNLQLAPSDREGAADPVERRVLIHGMRSISLTTAPDGGRSASPLPRLILLSFVTPSGAAWDIAIEPKLRGDALCRFDPVSLECRR